MTEGRETVVVTGLGVTTPLGGDVASTWAAMLASRSAEVGYQPEQALSLGRQVEAEQRQRERVREHEQERRRERQVRRSRRDREPDPDADGASTIRRHWYGTG